MSVCARLPTIAVLLYVEQLGQQVAMQATSADRCCLAPLLTRAGLCEIDQITEAQPEPDSLRDRCAHGSRTVLSSPWTRLSAASNGETRGVDPWYLATRPHSRVGELRCESLAPVMIGAGLAWRAPLLTRMRVRTGSGTSHTAYPRGK